VLGSCHVWDNYHREHRPHTLRSAWLDQFVTAALFGNSGSRLLGRNAPPVSSSSSKLAKTAAKARKARRKPPPSDATDDSDMSEGDEQVARGAVDGTRRGSHTTAEGLGVAWSSHSLEMVPSRRVRAAALGGVGAASVAELRLQQLNERQPASSSARTSTTATTGKTGKRNGAEAALVNSESGDGGGGGGDGESTARRGSSRKRKDSTDDPDYETDPKPRKV
jgi:hypothetical protein